MGFSGRLRFTSLNDLLFKFSTVCSSFFRKRCDGCLVIRSHKFKFPLVFKWGLN